MQTQAGDQVVGAWADSYDEIEAAIEKTKLEHYEMALKSLGYTLEFLGTEISPDKSEWGGIYFSTYARVKKDMR